MDVRGWTSARGSRLAGGLLWGAVLLGGAVSSGSAAQTPGRALSPSAVGAISITGQATPLTLGLGSGFTDTATLTPPAGGPGASGTITFKVYGPGDPGCTGPLIFSSTNTVVATPSLSGAYATPSSGLTPPRVGSYRIVAIYNGDGSYQPVTTGCGDPANTVLVGARPTLTAISPNSGPAGGANAVTITGNDLTGATTVSFGSAAVPATVVSSTQVLATAPAGQGTVDVTVTTPFGTTQVSAIDLYDYAAAAGSPAPPVVVDAPPAPPAPPVVVTGATTRITASTAEFNGTIQPGGLVSTAHFEYTVRRPGGATIVKRTPGQPVGILGGTLSADVSGLLPASRYRVRLIARSSAGETIGAATSFATPGAAAARPPVVGRTFRAASISGVVKFRLPGAGEPVQVLGGARGLPPGATIDTRAGAVRLTAAAGAGRAAGSGSFADGIFKLALRAAGSRLPVLALLRSSTARRVCAVPAGQAPPETALGLLRATTTGRFEIRGRYGSSTAAAATWTTTDRCDGLLTSVGRGAVVVNDLARARRIALRGGQTYLAKAR